MPSIEDNLKTWKNYDWSKQGDEWSPWGMSDSEWNITIRPRIISFLPTNTILEIAPGYGRWTQFLKDLCYNLIVIDLTPNCIEACKRRFASCNNIEYHTNDGKSLEMILDNTIDFVFSFDSLVHAESDVIEAYITQLAKKMNPNGIGFIHHSNIGEYYDSGKKRLTVDNPGWRAESMTAKKFEEFCKNVDINCISQEIINWGGGNVLSDCFSLIAKPSKKFRKNCRVINNNFNEEISRSSLISKLYNLNNLTIEKKIE